LRRAGWPGAAVLAVAHATAPARVPAG